MKIKINDILDYINEHMIMDTEGPATLNADLMKEWVHEFENEKLRRIKDF